MKFLETKLSGSYVINLDLLSDERGFFSRVFCKEEFFKMGLNTTWLQVNSSLSLQPGTLRGLHFQSHPCSEVKLVRCIQGAMWDVIVDLRVGEETFGKWYGAYLDAQNRTMMYVPKGFAHGFISLEPRTEIMYFVSSFYTPEFEQTLLWNDPNIGINWPIKPTKMSDKDAKGLTLNKLKEFL